VAKLLKNKAIGFLEAQKLELQAKVELAKRPKEVLLKYKELIRKADRDEKTLMQLEDKLTSLKLEDSRLEDPWQLITEPTLKDRPVAPSRRKIGLIGLLFGFFVGSGISLYKEKKSDKIHDKEVFEEILESSIIESKSIDEIENKRGSFLYLREFIKNNSEKKICLYAGDDIDKKYLKNIGDIVKNPADSKTLNNFDIVLSENDLDKFFKADEKFFLAFLGSTQRKQVFKLKRNLDMFDTKITGIILITN